MGIGKDYLSHESTYRHMASQSRAELMDRRMREDWEADGGTDIYRRSHDKMIKLLETYEPPQLPNGVLQDIREIVNEAEKEQGVG
jgi:trimethylamine--corrinoid protein Co-methyltransferase